VNAIVVIKRIAALCLLVSFFLPLSQCSLATVAEFPQPVRELQSQPGKGVIVTYAYSAYSWKGWQRPAAYAAFLWPVLLSIVLTVWPALRSRGRTIAALELLLCLGSAWMVLGLTMLGEMRYGGYIAWTALLVYFGAALADLLVRFLQRGLSPADARQNETP
jgi:hypothetical protein